MPGQKAPEGQRREQILAAAYQVASRDGIAGLTVRSVAARAGLSHGLVLFHFKRKEQLVAALLEGVLAATLTLEFPEEIARLPRPLDRLRSAQGILRLAQRYGAPRLEAACARALAGGEYRYHTVKAILAHNLDRQSLLDLAAPSTRATPAPRHARPWTTFFPDPGAEGGSPWN